MAKAKFQDPRGGHIRLYWDIVDSMAWQALSWADQGMYIAIRRKLSKYNNGNIEATLGDPGSLRHYGITSSASLARGLRALMAVGLIAKTRQGKLTNQGSVICNLFRFTDEEVFAMPKLNIVACKATNEWRQFTTLGAAKAAIRDAHRASLTGIPRAKRNAKTVQTLNANSSKDELSAGSNTEHGAGLRLQNLNIETSAAGAAKPRRRSTSGL